MLKGLIVDGTLPALWVGIALLALHPIAGAAVIGAILIMASLDATIFGFVLNWMKPRDPHQYAPEAAAAADMVERFKEAKRRYRPVQHTINWTMVGLATWASGWSAGAATALLLWAGVHDLFYHLLLMHPVRTDGYNQYWMWWTPYGMWQRFVAKADIRSDVILGQALLAILIATVIVAL